MLWTFSEWYELWCWAGAHRLKAAAVVVLSAAMDEVLSFTYLINRTEFLKIDTVTALEEITWFFFWSQKRTPRVWSGACSNLNFGVIW